MAQNSRLKILYTAFGVLVLVLMALVSVIPEYAIGKYETLFTAVFVPIGGLIVILIDREENKK